MMDEEKQTENAQPQKDDSIEAENSKAEEPRLNTETSPAEFDETADAPDLAAYAQAVGSQAESTSGVEPEPSDLPDLAWVDVLAQENETLKIEHEALKSQIEDLKSQYARLAADFDNFRKRTQKEKEELEVQIKCSTIKELLPVIDNFERARSQIKPQTDSEMNIHKSYQSVYKLMVDCLKRIGVAPMRPEGQPFDPNLHEAVMREATDQHPEGTVIEELMRGYLLGSRVLRHSMVKVATAPEPGEMSEETHQEESSDS